MGTGWPVACLVLAVLAVDVRAEDERWSRPATPERRQGDWVPLTCANCRPILDQGVQASNSLPSVLTPPPRAEEARLLPPPPPPDGLFQQAATGFLQAFTQQQPPRKHHQFLQETTAQSINRPQAQFLKANSPLVGPKPSQHFLQEPSQEFQPPQEPRQNRQPQQLLQYNQQFMSDQPYLNQPLLFGPQFLPAPFFPQTSIPPQNIQAISPVQLQPQNPISPNVLPFDSQNFQIPPNRPVFTQQITTGAQDLPEVPQQAVQTQAPQQLYSGNETDSQRNEEDKDEVQLLYVPVETLNQRARGKLKSLASNQQGVLPQQANAVSGNRFLEQNFDSSTRNSLLENQNSFNIQTQTSKPQYNSKQINQFQQQLPPVDQEKFNSQTHTVRQQFIKQNAQLQQQPSFANGENFKLESQNTKQQYNFKTNNDFQSQSQFQPDFSNFNSQINFQQNAQLQPQNVFEGVGNVLPQTQNVQFDVINQPQQDQANFNGQTFNINHQLRAQGQPGNIFQQQFPPLEQLPNFNPQAVNTQQFNTNQNLQFQQTLPNFKDQPYLNQPVQTDQPVQQNQGQFQQQTLVQQTNSQQQFENPEEEPKTSSPVAQTVTSDITNQNNNEQHFTSSQQDLRHLHKERNNQFLRKFPQDYQQSTTVSASSSTTRPVDASTPNTESYNHQRNLNHQQFSDVGSKQFHAGHQKQSNLSPVSSTLRPQQTTLAPNQPPLSVYMETTEESKVNDVLRLLKNAKSIQVLDTVGPESPQVFVGPSNLKAPTGYIKFELPYLNSLDSNRVERKVDQLPFFVAPLNFNPPPGYSKIPFPAPHVGSVVVSNVTILKTALHDKPYEDEPVPISSTEQYLNQYTLPDAISPISPQLPSLINSLRDEIYSASSTTLPSTSTESTTLAYTTPTYRGRGSNRGSQRGSSSYTTSPSATRRVQPRTRRPYSRRQPVTTTTTTEEPTTEITSQQSLTSAPEQQAFNSETYSVQDTITPSSINVENNQYSVQPENINTYYNDQFVANKFNDNRFSSQQQVTNQPLEHQSFQHSTVTGRPQNEEQSHHNVFLPQNEYTVEQIVQTTPTSVPSSDFPNEDNKFKSQKPNVRRDPSRHHQRFRNRQRLTTTTEIYEQPPQAVDNQFYTQTVDNHNNAPGIIGVHDQRLVENTHFQAGVSQDQYSIQTERADVGFQTTERLLSLQNEAQNNQVRLNSDHQNPQYNSGNGFDQTVFSQNSESSQASLYQPNTNQFSQNPEQVEHGFGQPINSQIKSEPHFGVNQFHQTQLQNEQYQPLNSKDLSHQQEDLTNSRNVANQPDHIIFNQQRHQENQAQNHQYSNNQQVFQSFPEKSIHNNQGQALPTSGQLEQVSEVTDAIPQEVYQQTTETASSRPQVVEEPNKNLYNQQRLKYNRPTGRVPITEDKSSNEYKRGHQHFHANVDPTDTTTADDVTTRASLVRVRGRVRSRQRGAVRQTTTTEEPNYPTSYLNRQKISNGNDDSQDYNTRKRVNFNSRPTYTQQRNINRDSTSEQSNEENYASTESQLNLEGSVDYTELSTTTTEASDKGPTRKYQHIINRNKLRRVRPTNVPSTSGSSGTTRFLHPTTQPPVTRLPSSTRGRIRKPVSIKSITSTTEYSQVKPSWNDKENFAPSAGSNEILEPIYQTKEKAESPFGFQRNLNQKTPSKPPVVSEDEDFWNKGVTIQQSTSFDFKPDAVTPPSFKDNDESQGTISPIWNGQVELQDGNYYDAFNQQHVSRNDQTPFSSDQQKIVYKDVKNRRPIGKDNQYTEKDKEEKKEIAANEEENVAKVYPVYREIARHEGTIDEESTPVFGNQYDADKSSYLKKGDEESDQFTKQVANEEIANLEADSEIKEGALKRKIIATHPGKKGGRRRGSWVRVRVRKPTDMFETAESQNLGQFSENAIQGVTKTTSEKAPRTPEPVTEVIHTTTTDKVSEPSQTITFEQALKDMLKEFITNPEEGHEETETEASTDWPSQIQTLNTTEGTNEEEEQKQLEEEVKETSSTQNSEAIKSKSTSDNIAIKQDKDSEITTAPEVTTEVFTQEPITVFPTIEVESAETTVEPEVTTTPNEEVKQPQSRVLGTSTTTEISLETEICYRGRCVKTKKLDSDSDLLTME